ncbi:MAG: hypothetical protein HC866_13870 [Leptolyngbyaceae cyanobacterium RU_5_1]|nr:hypothetical protein [Leptolyngbyaceae cyanobacterium RU_5_1]
MLSNVDLELVEAPSSVKRLLNAWTQVYSSNFQTLAFASDPELYTKLAEAISPEGRANTAAKLSKNMIALQCDMASIQTNAVYTYMENTINPAEIRRLSQMSYKIYTCLIALYRQGLLGTVSIPAIERSLTKFCSESSSSVPDGLSDGLSDIERLSSVLEPIVLEFQNAHTQAQTQSDDHQALLSWMTTQLNFCNQWIMGKLTLIEQFLLSPYLKFVEEQISHPWRQVCVAAARHSADSPVLTLVETMIPLSEEIAQSTCQSLVRLLPNHRSRRGGLTNPGVAHSCIRDLKTFQAYLWLCALEDNVVSVKDRLSGLCALLPSMEVKWELTELWTQVLEEEVLRRIEPSQQDYVLPCTAAMHQIFLNTRMQLDTSYPYSLFKAEQSEPQLTGNVSKESMVTHPCK